MGTHHLWAQWARILDSTTGMARRTAMHHLDMTKGKYTTEVGRLVPWSRLGGETTKIKHLKRRLLVLAKKETAVDSEIRILMSATSRIRPWFSWRLSNLKMLSTMNCTEPLAFFFFFCYSCQLCTLRTRQNWAFSARIRNKWCMRMTNGLASRLVMSVKTNCSLWHHRRPFESLVGPFQRCFMAQF